jgi:deoxypyrimidine-specific 5' nucleotidase type C protein (NT5C)
LEKVTRDWLDYHLIPYDRLVFREDKAQYCRDEGAKYLIDDAPHHAEECLDYGIGVFLFDYPYNRHIEPRGGLWRIEHPLELPPLLVKDIK